MTDLKTEAFEGSILAVAERTFRNAKALGDKAMEQLDEGDHHWTPDSEANSIGVIVKHMSGNMISRWTDFLTSDGEKPDRRRDDEFVDTVESHRDLIEVWERGWDRLFRTLEELTDEDLSGTVIIRGERLTVVDAVFRQISHYAYHVGQIVYIAKHLHAVDWRSLSIPRKRTTDAG